MTFRSKKGVSNTKWYKDHPEDHYFFPKDLKDKVRDANGNTLSVDSVKKILYKFQGKLKIQGNMGLAMKLQEFQKQAAQQLKAKL